MTVEAQCYTRRGHSKFNLEETIIVSRGGHNNTEFLGEKAQVVLYCNEANTIGTVSVDGEKNSIKAKRYRDRKDRKGQKLNIDSPIRLTGDERVAIFSRKKQIVVFLNPEVDSDIGKGTEWDIPQRVPEKVPAEAL